MAITLNKDIVKKTINDLKEDVYRCSFDCFNCTIFSPEYLPACPAYERYGFYTYASRGRAGMIEAYLAGKIPMSQRIAEIMFSCSMCGACRVCCQQDWKDYNLEAFLAMREEIVEMGFAPAKLRDSLKSIQKYGNPYGVSGDKRGEWAEGSGVEKYSGQEYLLYVGDECSFDIVGQKMAKYVVKVLQKGGVSFGILGEKEISDGHEVKLSGESGLYEYLVEKNIEIFNEHGVKKVVTLSPHSYNAMKNDYPEYGAKFEVIHYTTILKDLIDGGLLKPVSTIKAKIAYHDPCYLGRFNDDYDVPREVLKKIPGIELVGLPRERDKSFCCGGGGANSYTDLLSGGNNAPSRIRIREIRDSGADIVAVACPVCAIMLDDAVKAESLEDKLAVKDIAELILSSINE
ncbi:(Fe-S)-binding protein [Desulfofundulus thermobenzoicus]|uniref:(Fe-S)-binding protein n=1 Tax=Desulfofundulus thermobenzoicus TaxID=29376 RepID=A0A6N7IVH7_9FIRM|nr:(Fe-S)-binding protein [Desulfofundulus thermobenzoicus]MQL53573.1 (Fe-S)-binding protein [Desulfofundulus thermobenzoicus]